MHHFTHAHHAEFGEKNKNFIPRIILEFFLCPVCIFSRGNNLTINMSVYFSLYYKCLFSTNSCDSMSSQRHNWGTKRFATSKPFKALWLIPGVQTVGVRSWNVNLYWDVSVMCYLGRESGQCHSVRECLCSTVNTMSSVKGRYEHTNISICSKRTSISTAQWASISWSPILIISTVGSVGSWQFAGNYLKTS